ncbi:Agmatine deiminase, partial [Pseudolycoriella hygida]
SVESNETIRMPAEWEPHQRTLMAWPHSEEIWPNIIPVRRDIAKIANAIVDFEPVVMFADPSQVSAAESQLDNRVQVVGMPVDDLWARDTSPVFVLKTSNGQERVVGVDFNFNGWGNKAIHGKDSQVAKRVIEMFEMEHRKTFLVAEGGAFETDGRGTLFVAKSSIVNTNRNSQSIDEIEKELKSVLGIKKIIWFEGRFVCLTYNFIETSLIWCINMTSISRKMSTTADSVDSNDIIRMPAEWEPHQRTLMAWPHSKEIWPKIIPVVRRDIAKIANAIVDFEPVVMFADPSQVSAAESQLDNRVQVVGMPVDDLWARDTSPVFVLKTSNGQERVVGVDFNFNGWGNKAIHGKDSQVAKRVIEMFEMEHRKTFLVAEGGGFETDGRGTLFVTKSSIVNTNRNSQSIDEIEMELKTVLGVKKIIWFEGIKGQDITDFHVDSLVRFVRPGVVVLSRPFPGEPEDAWSMAADEAASILKNATDADGNAFQVIELVEPNPEKIWIKKAFNLTYQKTFKPELCPRTSKMSVTAETVASNDTIRLPAEWEPHLRTFMIWPQSEEIWSSKLLAGVREDVAKIANALVDFEPVVMLTDPSLMSTVESQLDKRVQVVGMPVDDLWARDTLPVFVLKTSKGQQNLVGVDFNFNGWGKKAIHGKDSRVAKRVVEMFKMEHRKTSIVSEGGALETDGRGTLLVTKSSIVNTNRNAHSIDEIEKELKTIFGVKKVIWFEGVRGHDITDAHVDALVRFVRPGVVVLNRPFPGKPRNVWSTSSDEAASVLKHSTDADGNRFQVVDLLEPDPEKISYKGDKKTFLSSYANFHIANGCVIIPAFGDKEADSTARTTLQELLPNRKAISILLKTLPTGGGGIHCATRDQPHFTRVAVPAYRIDRNRIPEMSHHIDHLRKFKQQFSGRTTAALNFLRIFSFVKSFSSWSQDVDAKIFPLKIDSTAKSTISYLIGTCLLLFGMCDFAEDREREEIVRWLGHNEFGSNLLYRQHCNTVNVSSGIPKQIPMILYNSSICSSILLLISSVDFLSAIRSRRILAYSRSLLFKAMFIRRLNSQL